MVDATDIAGYRCRSCGTYVSKDEAFSIIKGVKESTCICIACETESLEMLGRGVD